MRVIIRTVSLILLFGLQSVCLGSKADKRAMDIAESVERYVAAAQKQAQAEVEEALAEAKNDMDRAQKEMATAQEEMEAIDWEFDGPEGWRPNVAPTPPSVKLNRALSIITNKFGSDSAENVLVIPAGEMAGEQLGEIIEDMNIMSRIFEKNLEQADKLSASRIYFSVGRHGSTPKAIYLEGYGALFLMDVDFPLLPLPEPEEKETEEEDVDHVWQQAKREVFRSPDEHYFEIESEDEEEPYDAAKVEALKSKLIKNLKHASNIRNLPVQEWIVVAVTGSGRDSADIHIRGGMGGMMRGMGGGVGMAGSRGRSRSVGARGARGGRGRVSLRAGDAEIEVSGARGIDRDATTPLTSGNVLIMRAKKADVDAFAKEKLNFEQFKKRVQMFTY